jgi:uroporphyrinogen decarboxylase
MEKLDLARFLEDNREAKKENCFYPMARQVSFGVAMELDCVYDELGINDGLHPWAPRSPELMRSYIRQYNDKAEEIIGYRIMNENYPSKKTYFPYLKRIGEIFEGKYTMNEYAEWLEPTVFSAQELDSMLDRVEKLDLYSFVIPGNWENECRRVYEEHGLKPDPFTLEGRMVRGPVTAATSVMRSEDFIFLYYDAPELFERFGRVMGDVLVEYAKIVDRACGYTEENRPHGFRFNDDNCCLLTPEMYEVFGYPILKKVFDYCSPDDEDNRYQHSDSDMAHLVPILARFNLTGVNFGPNVLVEMIRPFMPKTRIDGCIAPLAIQRNNEEELVRQVKRDCQTAIKNGWRGLNIAAAGLTTYGSRLSSLALMMQVIQNFGRYD